VQQKARFGVVAPVENFAQLATRVDARQIGEKAEPPQIDPHQRHRAFGQLARRVQERAVAADHHGQFGFLGDFLESGESEFVGLQTDGGGGVLLQPGVESARAQEARQFENGLGAVRALELAYQGDIVEFPRHGERLNHNR